MALKRVQHAMKVFLNFSGNPRNNNEILHAYLRNVSAYSSRITCLHLQRQPRSRILA